MESDMKEGDCSVDNIAVNMVDYCNSLSKNVSDLSGLYVDIIDYNKAQTAECGDGAKHEEKMDCPLVRIVDVFRDCNGVSFRLEKLLKETIIGDVYCDKEEASNPVIDGDCEPVSLMIQLINVNAVGTSIVRKLGNVSDLLSLHVNGNGPIEDEGLDYRSMGKLEESVASDVPTIHSSLCELELISQRIGELSRCINDRVCILNSFFEVSK